MLEAALRRGYPVMLGVRRVLANELLMPAFEFGHPVAAFVHVKINDLAQGPGGWGHPGRPRRRDRESGGARGRGDGGPALAHVSFAGALVQRRGWSTWSM